MTQSRCLSLASVTDLPLQVSKNIGGALARSVHSSLLCLEEQPRPYRLILSSKVYTLSCKLIKDNQ